MLPTCVGGLGVRATHWSAYDLHAAVLPRTSARLHRSLLGKDLEVGDAMMAKQTLCAHGMDVDM